MTPRQIVLPEWLDKLIFDELGAEYCCVRGNMTVIDWDRADVLKYLGTYFPRSYAEAYCIFTDLFMAYQADYATKDELSLFDFGCGTGGELVGLLDAVTSVLPNIQRVSIKAFDGNPHALRLCEQVLEQYARRSRLAIELSPAPIEIKDFYDLSIFKQILKRKYDLFISFKAICEFVTKQEFKGKNPYQHIIETFAFAMNKGGRMCLVDISSFNQISQDWLPKMMDKGLCDSHSKLLMQNAGWNEVFTVTHSRHQADISKVSWRLFEV